MGISFNGGSQQQRDLITQAHQKAAVLTSTAIDSLPTSADVAVWFGSSSRALVAQNLNAVLGRLRSGSFLYDFTAMLDTQPLDELYLFQGTSSSETQTVLVPCVYLFQQPKVAIAVLKAAFSIVQLCASTATQVDTTMGADRLGARYLAAHAPDIAVTSPSNYRYFIEDLTLSYLPVGTITPFAGDLSDPAILASVQGAGWLVCDGAAYHKALYPDLFEAIGTAHGGDAVAFRVPDLRDRFVRGTLENAVGVDPDAAARIAAADGGATGNRTGSLQRTATGLPVAAWSLQGSGLHTHTCQHLTSEQHMAWNGSTYRMARWAANAQTENAGAHFHALVGFDSATVPVHVALYYLIKASEPQTPVGTIPAGAICAFGGPLTLAPARWLKCDGTSYGAALYPHLLEMIFYNYGGDGQTVLSVPDLRGYFLRGTDHGMNRDPDAAGRHELNAGGNTGDNVGSAQLYATASPTALAVTMTGDHSHDISAIPQDDHHAAWGASGPLAYNCMLWTDAITTSSRNGDHTHTVAGGDHESRPENIYSSYLVASDNLPESAPPIGAVMSFGGDFTDPGVRAALLTAGWLPCDGSLVRISAFPELYRVVGTTFGSAPLKFAVPDLRGYFVTGAGKVALGTLQATSTTGVPGTPIVSSTGGDHAHTMPNVPPDTHVIDVVAGVDLAENNPSQSPTSTNGAHSHAIRGGDRESRPVNVTVDHIIRFQ